MDDVFGIFTCTRIFDLVSVPLAFVRGGVDVMDAVNVVGEVGVGGSTYGLWVGWDDCVGGGVDVCVFEQVDFTYLLSE